jgi:hypothetical protein
VKEWRSEWFYAGNMLPALAIHSDSGPSVNDRWEKNPLSSKELKKIQPLLETIQVLKQQVMSIGPIFREVAGKFDLWRSRCWRSGFKSDTIQTLQPLHHCSISYQPRTT